MLKDESDFFKPQIGQRILLQLGYLLTFVENASGSRINYKT